MRMNTEAIPRCARDNRGEWHVLKLIDLAENWSKAEKEIADSAKWRAEASEFYNKVLLSAMVGRLAERSNCDWVQLRLCPEQERKVSGKQARTDEEKQLRREAAEQ